MNARLESIIVAVIIALFAVGGSLGVLVLPPVTRIMVDRVGSAESAGLPQEVAFETAEHVRAYVAGADVDPLPDRVEDRAGFSADAISHLDDVRDVMAWAGWATLACLVFLAGWLTFRFRRDEKRPIVRGLRAGSLLLATIVPLVVFLGTLDFERFFAGFHALFFEANTWRFPEGDLLIQLFPETFWITAGVVWAVLILLEAAALWVWADVVERSRTT